MCEICFSIVSRLIGYRLGFLRGFFENLQRNRFVPVNFFQQRLLLGGCSLRLHQRHRQTLVRAQPLHVIEQCLNSRGRQVSRRERHKSRRTCGILRQRIGDSRLVGDVIRTIFEKVLVCVRPSERCEK